MLAKFEAKPCMCPKPEVPEATHGSDGVTRKQAKRRPRRTPTEAIADIPASDTDDDAFVADLVRVRHAKRSKPAPRAGNGAAHDDDSV